MDLARGRGSLLQHHLEQEFQLGNIPFLVVLLFGYTPIFGLFHHPCCRRNVARRSITENESSSHHLHLFVLISTSQRAQVHHLRHANAEH